MATLIAVVWSIGWFPSGRYPRIVLMLPGIAVGLAFFFFGSLPVYSYEHKRALARRAAEDGETATGTTEEG